MLTEWEKVRERKRWECVSVRKRGKGEREERARINRRPLSGEYLDYFKWIIFSNRIDLQVVGVFKLDFCLSFCSVLSILLLIFTPVHHLSPNWLKILLSICIATPASCDSQESQESKKLQKNFFDFFILRILNPHLYVTWIFNLVSYSCPT